MSNYFASQYTPTTFPRAHITAQLSQISSSSCEQKFPAQSCSNRHFNSSFEYKVDVKRHKK
ncbi:hypothetical protein BofuT4_P067180.1 [Botrytis cinerea T4]|uniref:Uncharacterized protein n=1 Tax=Botryotinia fuckeliana (strain T4) TaxID=999810 RepID=G2XRE2_BOTF4|nr:hypothetical protein BofuT4_P067180.1 [Botrytis cinerea T4]